MGKDLNIRIGFIGGGNMGEALIAALFQKKIFTSRQIGVYDVDPKRLQRLKKKYRIVPFSSNRDLAEKAPTLLLAVKPQQMSELLREISPILSARHLLISIAAGLDTSFFAKHLPAKIKLIRTMPNMGSLVGEGAAVLFCGPGVSVNQRRLAARIFSAAGQAFFVKEEKLLDAVTAVSGSGPAFVFLFLKAFLDSAEKLTLSPSLTRSLVLQTFRGALKIAELSKEPLTDLIQKVASKGGTTEAGLRILQQGRLEELVLETLSSAARRAEELRCTS